MNEELMTRKKILEKAINCTTGQRQEDYGTPEDNFSRIARLWSAYHGDKCYTAADVAVMLALLKIARIKNSPIHMDNWVDLAGYAACGGEIADRSQRVSMDCGLRGVAE